MKQPRRHYDVICIEPDIDEEERKRREKKLIEAFKRVIKIQKSKKAVS